MHKLDVYNVNVENAYDVVKENIYSCVVTPRIVEDTKFHHEIDIKQLPNAINYGLLSKRNYVNIVENRQLTEEEIFIFSDECHVNGLDHVSISTMEMDFNKMYRNEDIWLTYSTVYPTIVVSKNVKAHMSTQNYFNEFIVENQIPVEMFNAIDVKILGIMSHGSLRYKCETKEDRIRFMLEYYEHLRDVALALKTKKLDIPIREVSDITDIGQDDKALTLDTEKIIELPKLLLK